MICLVQLTGVRKKRKKAQITVNALGREGGAREGEGRRTTRPSSFAKRRLRSQLINFVINVKSS